jgi:hypothetical protein
MTMRPETAIEQFKKWQANATSVVVCVETEGIRLLSPVVVLDVNASGVSFSFDGGSKRVLLISFEGASFEETFLLVERRGLSGLVITFPNGGTCTTDEFWSNEPPSEPENPTDVIQ